MFIIIFILIIAFLIYMWLNNGYIYIASNHFEKEISVKKIKNKHKEDKQIKNRCKKCGKIIDNEKEICDSCIMKESNLYNSLKDYKDKK